MAELTYVLHPGYGLTAPGEAEEYISVGTLATLYGLESDEYEVDDNVLYDESLEYKQIHLRPRVDGKYVNIKTELGDNGTNTIIAKEPGWKKKRQERLKNLL